MKGDIFLVTFVLFLCYFSVDGSGYLKNPASRNSIWRYFGAASFASNIIANHDDMNVNCGGTFVKDHNDLPQKCGICGDPKNGPLDHEDPSKYAKGYITQVYHEGTTINVTVTVTGKKEGGFFMLDLCCPAGNSPITEQCFQRLIFKDTNSNTLPINNFEGDGSFEVILPPGVTGDRCVMRWIWITAAEYGCDDDKPPPQRLCGRGYGNQPTFVNCADVKIVQKTTQLPLAGFEAPVYEALYSSMDGTTKSTNKPPVFTLSPSKEPVIGQSSTTTETPPTKSGSLIGPIIPGTGGLLGGGGGLLGGGGGLLGGDGGILGGGGGLLGGGVGGGLLGGGGGLAAGNNAGNAISNLFNGGTGTAAGTAAGTGTNTGLFGGTGNGLASLIPLLLLLSIFPALAGATGGRGGGGGGEGQRIIITGDDPPPRIQTSPLFPGRGGPFPPSRWMPRFGSPVFVPGRQAWVSAAPHVSTGYQRRRGYGKSNRYSSYNG